MCAQCIRSGGVGTRCSGIPLFFLDCVFHGFGRFACGTCVENLACLFADVAHSALLSLPFSCAHSRQVCQVPWCDFLAGNGRFYCVAIILLVVRCLLARAIRWIATVVNFSLWFLGRVSGIMAAIVNGNGRSCGALSAVILGLMCAPLMLWWQLDTIAMEISSSLLVRVFLGPCEIVGTCVVIPLFCCGRALATVPSCRLRVRNYPGMSQDEGAKPCQVAKSCVHFSCDLRYFRRQVLASIHALTRALQFE